MPGPTLTLRHTIKVLSPAFFREGVDERIMYVFGLARDAILDKLTQAILGRMPTRCDPSFFPPMAADRLVILGPTEPEDSIRRRLQTAFDNWQIAGTARSVLSETLPLVLPFEPQIREVSTRFETDPARIPIQVAQGVGFPIVGASNATPIELTLSVPHGLTTGRKARVGNVGGNTAANNTGGTAWTITVTGELTFELDSSVGNGAYTSGGNVMAFATAYPPARLSSTWDTYPANAEPGIAPVHVYAPAGGNGEWDWDSTTQETPSWMWQETFVMLYAVAPEDFAHPPTWVVGDASLEVGSIPGSVGLDVDADYIENIRVAVRLRKAANTIVRYIMIVFDGSIFSPDSPVNVGVNPDGTFGDWHALTFGIWSTSRYSDVAYCSGV